MNRSITGSSGGSQTTRLRMAMGGALLMGVTSAILIASAACTGGGGAIDDGTTPTSTTTPTGTTTTTGTGTTTPPSRIPVKHRATAAACDNVRNNPNPNVPDGGGPPTFACTSHGDCTAGRNGQCLNGRAGTQCTYDECLSDSECGGGNAVCECPSDTNGANRCLKSSGCKVDSDCAGGFACSPTLGTCGHYSGTEAYFCHTAADECVDDKDCGSDPNGFGGYCAFEQTVGHWKCSTSECAG